MMEDEWLVQLQELTTHLSVRAIADAIPADPVTVWRALNGTTQRPSLAFVAGVRRAYVVFKQGRSDAAEDPD